jgi:3-methyladenine DNA glycosylase/8-oxoguanine DNA glycosylase
MKAHRAVAQSAAMKRMRLKIRAPYDAGWMLRFLAKRAIPELESVQEGTYVRVLDDPAGAFSVRATPRALSLAIPEPLLARAAELKRCARRIFDVDADSATIDAHLATDARLCAAVRRSPGLRVPGAFDGFELAVRAILGQQVSVARATALARSMVQRYGALGDGRFAFPSAACLARQTPAEIGIPGRRGDAIRLLAERVARGDLDVSEAMTPEALRKALTGISGIGPWTAEYIAMRAGRDPDAFPDSDWVITRQLGTSPAGARRLAEAWRPFRAYAVMYLWASAAMPRIQAA